MITLADNMMLPQLKNIWSECFGDTGEYIDFYFSQHFKPQRTLVYLKDDKPVSMLTLLPAKLIKNGKYVPVCYVYAVATLPLWQGLGISTQLLSYAGCELAKSGVDITVLAPASNKLFAFYKKCGYTEAFAVKQAAFAAEDKPINIKTENILPQEYKILRDKFFCGEGYLCWDKEAIEYALCENSFCGGFNLKITANGATYAAMCRIKDEVLCVKEATLIPQLIRPVLSFVAKQNNCKSVELTLPYDSAFAGDLLKKGMASTALVCGYMNLVLD
ncbi:MAG: GNAT family N-acetyltransferase [Hydrogenoanaerobacterium sp.]